MKIAVISDIHENAHNLILAVNKIKEEKCDVVFCLGDVGKSQLFKIIFTLNLPLYFVFGNHDGNIVADMDLFHNKQDVYTSPDMCYERFELGEKKFFLTHYDDLARDIAKSGEYDVVFGGHTHDLFEEWYGETLCVNPGEIAAVKYDMATFYIYDSEKHKGAHVYLENTFHMLTSEVKDFLKDM